MLSRTASTTIHVPLLNNTATLGREQLEAPARPYLDRTVTATLGSLDDFTAPALPARARRRHRSRPP